MFYFDGNLKKYEADCSWDEALLYLEDQFLKFPTCEKLNSLVGFSWYYLVEGPIDSGKYENDENSVALDVWKKYLGIGFREYFNDPRFCFIAGYSLLLHGLYIEEFRNNHELVAIEFLTKASNSNACNLKAVISVILEYQKHKKYKPIKIRQEILSQIFPGESLLEKYFREIYS